MVTGTAPATVEAIAPADPPPPPALPEHRYPAAVTAGPALLGLVLCLIDITGRSLGFDEAATAAIAAQSGHALATAIAHDGGNMSGYYVVVHVLTGVFGSSAFVLRLPSALCAGATAGLVAALARRLFGTRVGLIAGLLTAVSLPLVYWGQNARGYAPTVMFTVAAFLCLARLADRPSAASGGERPARLTVWAGYVLFTALAIYSSFDAVLVVPAQLLIVLWRRPLARPLAFAMVALAAACSPLIVLAAARGSGQLFWLPRPTFEGEVQVFQALTGAGLEPNFHATLTTTPLLVLSLLGLVAVAAGILRRLLRRRAGNHWGEAVVLAWLAFPVAFAWIQSYFGQPIFLPRNLLVAAPAVSILLGLGLARAPLSRPLMLAAVGGLLALRALQIAPAYGTSPEDWRAAVRYVMASARLGDCIAFYPTDGRMAFQFYLGNSPAALARAPRPILPLAPWGHARAYVENYAGLPPVRLSTCPRLWLVSSHIGETDGPAGSRLHRTRFFLMSGAVTRRYPRRHSVKFGYASAIWVELAAG